MSEAIKPTPGPWTVVENSWEVSTVSAGSVEVARCYVDCNVTEDTQAEDEATMNANARLIAAAPELLDALKACAGVCAGEVTTKSGLINALEKARAVMRKATGETHEQ